VPEGDDVHRLARRLHAALAGQVLTATDFRVPRLAGADLSGERILEVAARGKHLLMRTDGGRTVHSHLKMDGAWRVIRPGERWRGAAHEVRAVLSTDRAVAVGTLLGILDVWPTAEEDRHFGHLGPDVLGPGWDPAEALRRLTEDPARPLGEALVDQRVMAGPGNVYRSEVCFLRGIDPRTPVGGVADPAAVVALVKRVMEANRDRAPRVTTGHARRGRNLWVYGRGGEPCRRCGMAVERIVMGAEPEDRAAFLCPSCQPPG
jgi:endonuclease-8